MNNKEHRVHELEFEVKYLSQGQFVYVKCIDCDKHLGNMNLNLILDKLQSLILFITLILDIYLLFFKLLNINPWIDDNNKELWEFIESEL